MSAASLPEAASRRDRSIRLAISTSLLSKVGTLLLQLVSIPLAVRIFGRTEFGLYTTVNLTLTTVSMLEVGVGPALAHGLSKARATGSEEDQKILGSTAFFTVLGVAILVAILLAAVLLTVPLAAIYGQDFAGKESVMRPALWVGLGLFLMFFLLNLTERIREGHLEVAANNLWGAAGNLTAAAAVGFGVLAARREWFTPEIWCLVLAVHGSLVLAKGANTISLWRTHPAMIPRLSFFRKAVAKHLFSDGMSFSTSLLLTGLVEYNLCGWMVGRLDGGPAATALYGVFISLTVMQLGFVIMLSTPTWPAVAEALARDDYPWARRAAKRLYLFGTGFAFCSAIGLIAIGPWVLPLWLGKDFSGISRAVLACYSLYFVAHVWRHLNHALMVGTGQVGRLARIQVVESVLVAGIAYLALRYGSMEIMLLAMAVVMLSITGWLLPRQVAAMLRK
ncbi:MAG: hypothetical protein JWO82_4313 [Akkermansiaceae bacterium]|nr:hypothetical protein [Akkermansiaceae bacterium]